MSIRRVSSTDNQSNIMGKISAATAAGAVVGGGYVSTKKNWLFRGMPSDTFVRDVSRNLRKNLTSDELKESSRINKFVQDVVNPEIEVETLKPQIRASEELSQAIKATPDEGLEDALVRVFSQPKEKIKQDLLDLQYKTVIDKKASKNTALKLVNDNYDASTKKLVKNPETSENMFNMIKSTARKIQAKSIVAGALIAGAVVGAIGLIVADIPEPDKK